MVSTRVTSGCAAYGEDSPSFKHVVAIQAHDERLGRAVAEHSERGDDAIGHRIAGGDAAEDVHKDAAHGRVGQDDLEAVGHHLRRRAAADVEEVGPPVTPPCFSPA